MSLTDFTLPNNSVVELLMPRWQNERLAKRCFAGENYHMAGNFFAWRNFPHFLQDEEVRTLLTSTFSELAEDGNGSYRFELVLSRPVGWTSVVEMAKLASQHLRQTTTFPLNESGATALFLPQNLVKAPKTNIVTMAVEFVAVTKKFVIGTIYPGHDCGRLEGDMSQRLDLVWLHWDNLGED
jgi:hypothetical protein